MTNNYNKLDLQEKNDVLYQAFQLSRIIYIKSDNAQHPLVLNKSHICRCFAERLIRRKSFRLDTAVKEIIFENKLIPLFNFPFRRKANKLSNLLAFRLKRKFNINSFTLHGEIGDIREAILRNVLPLWGQS